jgi:hypothetical protein
MVSGILLSEKKMKKDYWTEDEYEAYVDDDRQK